MTEGVSNPLHPLQLVGTRVRQIHFQINPKAVGSKSSFANDRFSLNLAMGLKRIAPDSRDEVRVAILHELKLTGLSLTRKKSPTRFKKLHYEIEGFFVVPRSIVEEFLDEESARELMLNMNMILYGVARGYVLSITGSSIPGGYSLPAISLQEAFEQTVGQRFEGKFLDFLIARED